MKKSSKKVRSRLKKGDFVKVIAGNHRGEKGKLLELHPTKRRGLVEGVNLRVHHQKPTKEKPKGSLEKREAPLDLSNLILLDPVKELPTRIGRKKNEAGKLQRYAKKTGRFL